MAGLDVASNVLDPRLLADTIRQLVEGKSNAVGTFTCAVSTTATTVPAPTCAPGSIIMLSPLTADAAAALTVTWAIAGLGHFTVNHANSAVADRTFGFEVRG